MIPDQYIILKPIGITAEEVHKLHDFVESPGSKVFAGPNNPGIPCVEILDSKLDRKFGTYTMEVKVIIEMFRYEYTDGDGKHQKHPVKHGNRPEDTRMGKYHIMVSSQILLTTLSILGLLGRATIVNEKF